MIHVRQLVKYYGTRLALDRLDLDAPRGRVIGLLGPNGAGKTTALRMLTGFMPATSGEAVINGHDVFRQSHAARRSIGYLPESNPLYPELRVREQLHFFGRLHGLDRRRRRTRIEELADSCGLREIVHRQIGTLSKGNRQRVGLAQALLHDPPVLILDEPTEGLDPSQITGVRKLIRTLGERKTILLSTHILPEVEKTCDGVVILARGRIVAQGTPGELIERVRAASRIVMEVKAPAEDVRRVLHAEEPVGAVDAAADHGWCRAAVAARRPGEDIRERLGDAVIRNRWPLREMRPEAASLEEFFIQATSGEQPPDAPHPPAPRPVSENETRP